MEIVYSEKVKVLFICLFFGTLLALINGMKGDEEETKLSKKNKHTLELLKIFAAIAAGFIGGSEIIFRGIKTIFINNRMFGFISLSAIFLGLIYMILSYVIDDDNTKTTHTENIENYLIRKKTKYSTVGIVLFLSGTALLFILVLTYCF